MDSEIENFLKTEKPSQTDNSHKCVARKFAKWLREYHPQYPKSARVCLSRERYKVLRTWKPDQPPHTLPPELINDNIFARFLMHCLLELKDKKSSLRAAHGWISFVCKGKITSMKNTETIYAKIKQRPVYKDHIPKKALVPTAAVHVKLAKLSTPSLFDAYSIVIYNLAVLLARRGDEARKFTTKSIAYEKNRKLGGFYRPRVSFNILNNKEDPEGEVRIMSMNATRECVLECYTCAEDHDNNNSRCPLSTIDMVWEARTELYLRSLGSS